MGLFNSSVEDWAAYVEKLVQYVRSNDMCDEKEVAVLLTIMMAKTYDLLCNLTFADIMEMLQNHLTPEPPECNRAAGCICSKALYAYI